MRGAPAPKGRWTVAKLVEVFRSTLTADAQIKASLLNDQGIRATVVEPNLAASVGAGSLILPARVMVPEDQIELARVALEAIAEIAEAAPPTEGPTRCPSCGAAWEPGFSVCWQCQYDLEAEGDGQ